MSLSIEGEVSEFPSFISILCNECNGIGLDKLIVCIAVIFFYKKQWHLLYEIKSFIIKSLTVLFSVFMVIGISFSSNGSFVFINGSFSQFIVSVLVFVGYYCLFNVSITFLFKKLDVVNILGFLFKINFLEKLNQSRIIQKHYFAFATLAIMAGWLPYIIIFFPGSVPWDGRRQISEGAGYLKLTNHHPWIVSKFMGLLMQLGQLISDNAGVFLIVVVFMVIEALCYGFVCCKVKKYMGKYLFFISILFFALMPAFAAFSCVVLKDGLNAALVAYFMAIYIDCCMKANQQQLSVKDFVWLGISALLVCITRKNGVYLVLPQCLCLAAWVKKRKQILCVVLLSISILAGQIITDIKLPEYLGVVKGSEREMLSIPFQQTARYLLYFPEDVTVEEQAAIDVVLSFDQIAEEYYPEKSDAVKSMYKGTEGNEELKNYFKAWFSMLKKHPEIYLEATLEGSYGYLYPFRNCIASERYFFYTIPATNGSMYWHYLFSNEIRIRMEAYADLWVSVPILAQLMNPGTYTWLILILAAYIIYKKRTKGILMYVACFMNILVCIASPVNGLLRYALPLMACMPLLIGWSYHYCKNFEENL